MSKKIPPTLTTKHAKAVEEYKSADVHMRECLSSLWAAQEAVDKTASEIDEGQALLESYQGAVVVCTKQCYVAFSRVMSATSHLVEPMAESAKLIHSKKSSKDKTK